MLSFDEARARLLGTVSALGAERVGIFEADGRVLAETIVAPYALPAFDHSSMDGYAVRTSELTGAAPFELDVVGTSAAGDASPIAPARGGMRIFTGAPLPDGLDAIVMQEDVEVLSQSADGARIRFSVSPAPGTYVRKRGDDLKEGAAALVPGERLDPGKIALAASLDRATLLVGRRPVVTVLGSGDELRSPGEPARPNSVVESNGFFVAGAARRVGATARLAPFMADDPERSRRAVEAALAGTDVLVTIGGVSVGARDHVKPALEAAGVGIDFYKVAMKPGKPLTVGRAKNGALVLGLPGNPASASLTFLLFGVPVLRALQGDRAPLPRPTRLRVEGKLARTPGRTEFARAKLEQTETGETIARLMPNQASGAVTSFAQAEALVVFPADRGPYAGGEVLDVLRIADLLHG